MNDDREDNEREGLAGHASIQAAITWLERRVIAAGDDFEEHLGGAHFILEFPDDGFDVASLVVGGDLERPIPYWQVVHEVADLMDVQDGERLVAAVGIYPRWANRISLHIEIGSMHYHRVADLSRLRDGFRHDAEYELAHCVPLLPDNYEVFCEADS